ncbi:NAD(P)H-dependent oxidoreductase [Rubripirellula amarantea]|uniref:FMN-dependent NADPH-azoreductase n=1 Tax=Rubripirellula amarantea TaxID=2527999 RepID=A0A5C5WHD0_9BACT|nr:NAD(P)H-dependent oxidoreductase [Rubripirellula amarantea]MDA8746088.1 NAD(P)H-dependent oxidoreductase [Rubripirellula amarantea]TWT50196.1 FMN-dependent NADPH-azoreductase [Rubripirellula amarantea]
MSRIIAFAGSTRVGSYNKMLLRAAVENARRAGGEVTHVDLRDYPMPLYDGDLEESEGQPPHATELYEMMKEHQGLLLACPEYNSSITGVLKNTIDWVSRPRDGDPPMAAFAGKTAALMSASPGALGGLRGLVHVRAILGNIGVTVIANQIAVPRVMDVFDDTGTLVDARTAEKVAGLAKELVETTNKLHG